MWSCVFVESCASVHVVMLRFCRVMCFCACGHAFFCRVMCFCACGHAFFCRVMCFCACVVVSAAVRTASCLRWSCVSAHSCVCLCVWWCQWQYMQLPQMSATLSISHRACTSKREHVPHNVRLSDIVKTNMDSDTGLYYMRARQLYYAMHLHCSGIKLTGYASWCCRKHDILERLSGTICIYMTVPPIAINNSSSPPEVLP